MCPQRGPKPGSRSLQLPRPGAAVPGHRCAKGWEPVPYTTRTFPPRLGQLGLAPERGRGAEERAVTLLGSLLPPCVPGIGVPAPVRPSIFPWGSCTAFPPPCSRLRGVLNCGGISGWQLWADSWVGTGVPWHPGGEPWGLGAGQGQRGCWAGTAHHLCIWETSCPSSSSQPGRKPGLLAKSRLPCPRLWLGQTVAQPGCSRDTPYGDSSPQEGSDTPTPASPTLHPA